MRATKWLGMRVGLAMVASLVLVACGGGGTAPPLDRLIADVRRLDEVVPVIEGLRVTHYENSVECANLGYARGDFGNLEQEGCRRDGTIHFDADALADHARLVQAIETSGVATHRILDGTYRADVLESARFAINGAPFLEAWHYLYDPMGVEARRDDGDGQVFTRLDDAWWFVSSPDD